MGKPGRPGISDMAEGGRDGTRMTGAGGLGVYAYARTTTVIITHPELLCFGLSLHISVGSGGSDDRGQACEHRRPC